MSAEKVLTDNQIAAIEARHNAATRGPYQWRGWLNTKSLWLCAPRMLTVMDFVRWGLRSAAPRFLDSEHILHRADELITAGGDTVYGINHPDAIALERSWEDVDALLVEVKRLRAYIGGDASSG